MKRLIGFAAFLMLAGCGSSNARLQLALTSNDTATAALTTGSASSQAGASDLTGVQHVNVTVNSVAVHVDDGSSEVDEKTGEVDGSKVEDGDSNWQVVSSTPQSFDLIGIRVTSSSLGTITLPTGKITQVRLALKTDGDAGNGDDVIHGAVVDSDGSTCDLIVPHSAANPGVKIDGLFKAEALDANTTNVATINFRLKDSEKLSGTATCAFRLNPTIEIEKFEKHDDGAEDHGDGGTESEHADGGI